jgi:hypothetical protein
MPRTHVFLGKATMNAAEPGGIILNETKLTLPK